MSLMNCTACGTTSYDHASGLCISCRKKLLPHQPRELIVNPLANAIRALDEYAKNEPSPLVRNGPMPTPLYVTQKDKGVLLRFKTQEEADAAWRILSALAEAHADRTHAEQGKELRGAELIEEIRRKCPTDTDVED